VAILACSGLFLAFSGLFLACSFATSMCEYNPEPASIMKIIKPMS